METTLTLIQILAVLAIGVISPGPSFILVARTAVAVSRAAAMSAAFGMATGATLLGIAALLGLNALLHQIPSAYLTLKVVGGIYLHPGYLGHQAVNFIQVAATLCKRMSPPLTIAPLHMFTDFSVSIFERTRFNFPCIPIIPKPHLHPSLTN